MTFNPQKAREVAEKCQSRDDSIDHDYWNAHAGLLLPEALDEIDRQAKRIAELEADNEHLRTTLKKLGRAKRERGKVLVEERKLRMQLDASRFGMGIPEEIAIMRARDQLRREGKL